MRILLLFLLASNFFSGGTDDGKWDIRKLKWGYGPVKVEMVEGNGNNISRKFGSYGLLIKFRYKGQKLYKVIYSSYDTRFFNKEMNVDLVKKLDREYGERREGFNSEYLWKNLVGRKYMLKKESPESGELLENIFNERNYDGLNKMRFPDMWKGILKNIFVECYVWEKSNTVVVLEKKKNILTFFDIREYRRYSRKIKKLITELKNQSIK